MKKIHIILITLVVFLSFWLRLYKIDNPVADWHSFRQADTASVTREFVKQGVNVLIPKYHDLSNIQSGKDNPNGFRMVEMPLYNLLHLSLFRLFPSLGLDAAGRLTSIFLSEISLVLVFLITYKLSGFFVGWLASLFMAVLPFNIYYSRVILPEPLMVTTLLASFYLLLFVNDQDGLKRRLCFIFSSVFLAIALLVKPYAIFFVLPHIAIILRLIVNKKLNIIDLLSYGLVSLTPLYWWRKHILMYPQGIPASDWLLNSSGIRFRPAWFRWLFGERLGKLILGVYGTAFLLLGLIAKPKREGLTYWLWFIGIIVYFVVIAGGNVQHDYYQAIIMPFLCILLAKGAYLVLSLSRETYSRWLTLLTACGIFGFMIALSWYDVSGYYQINNWPIVEAGREVDKITPENAKIIAPYNGDTAFLYQTNRTGWPLGYDIEDKIAKGASYYVSVSYDDEARELEKKYTTIAKTNNYIIIKLTK